MKKFNKKTLIIGILILIGVLAMVYNTFSQEWLNPEDLNPPENLFATVEGENDVNLFWTEPSSGGSTTLHWDSGENADSFGNFLQPAEFDFAAKFDPDHITAYDGWTITKMRFWVVNPMPTIQLKIWTGPDATEIYSQDVPTFNINNWTEITLDVPVTIDASTQLWAGINVDMPVTGPVMGGDEGPAIDEYGNLYRFNGTWYHDFDMNWNIQIEIEEPELPTYLHWDSGENEDSFGNFLQPVEFDFASKWDPIHISAYDGWTVTKMRFYLTNPMPTVKLKIWTGPDATEIYSQDITSFNINDWTEITLDNPVTIDASTQFWIGLNVDMPSPGPVMGSDSGPAIDGYGNIYRQNGSVWYSDFDLNWNIQFEVENPDGKAIDGLLGYNVFRDDEQLNTNIWTSTSYVDENLLNGTYNYFVTAVYDEGESDPSNTVEVIIDQPTILYADSMALVDLYNNCNGPDWNYNDLWLEGPVNEWYGVQTEGSRVTTVFLSNNNVNGDIPESFGNITALVTFMATSNDITSIPESIGNLEALTELWLGHSLITSIPESIGNLTNLEELSLTYMNLGTLPETFGNLESLRWLGLGDAGLISLPESFGDLTSVQNCFIWGNNLTELPEGIGGMESLRYLTLSQNQLTTLPESIGDLDNLGWLYVEDNQLTSLPESFGSLSSLDTLKLAVNMLTALPESIGDLDDLNYLSVSLNSLTELPASITDLATIQEIYVDQNQISALPEDIGNLGNSLMAMSLSDNNISILPESMSELVNLYTLFANNNQIENIPINVGNMANLHFLGLDNNNIEVVPESIGNLSLLGYIGMTNNEINALPETFGNLEADTVLLSGNNIPELPSTMFDNNYHFLWVDQNNLQFGSIEPIMGQALEFIYDPQAMIGNDTIIEVVYDETISYTIEVSGDNNIYNWYKDGTLLPDQTSNNLYFENATASDQGIYVLKVTNTSVFDLELVSYDVTVNYITGIDDVEIIDFKMYPNPVSGNTINISVDNPQAIEGLMIINGSGQIVMTEMMTNRNNIINIGGLPKGIYIVKVIYVDGLSQMEKLIVR